MKKINIIHAGCVENQVKETVERFNIEHKDTIVSCSRGGSVDCIRRMKAGEDCDLLILADDAIIAGMMIPDWADGYYIFAGNRMVVFATSPDHPISSENWIEKLLDPNATFGHYEPSGDPGGYRAVMVCMLADAVRPGLSSKLLDHPGHKILKSPEEAPPDYMFGYYTRVASNGVPFAQLPMEMDLSDPALNSHYSKATIDLDGDGSNIVRGSAICHALTIPFSAKNPASAMEFVDMFLEIDFEAAHFISKK